MDLVLLYGYQIISILVYIFLISCCVAFIGLMLILYKEYKNDILNFIYEDDAPAGEH